VSGCGGGTAVVVDGGGGTVGGGGGAAAVACGAVAAAYMAAAMLLDGALGSRRGVHLVGVTAWVAAAAVSSPDGGKRRY
jgi:hypothetical protein